MNTKRLGLLLLVLAATAMGGCIYVADHSGPKGVKATSAELALVKSVSDSDNVPTLREKYAAQFARLEPGMPVADFRSAFTESTFVEQRKSEEGTVDAYSVVLRERYRYHNNNVIYTQHDEAWFYFRDGKLVKWGEDNDWP